MCPGWLTFAQHISTIERPNKTLRRSLHSVSSPQKYPREDVVHSSSPFDLPSTSLPAVFHLSWMVALLTGDSWRRGNGRRLLSQPMARDTRSRVKVRETTIGISLFRYQATGEWFFEGAKTRGGFVAKARVTSTINWTWNFLWGQLGMRDDRREIGLLRSLAVVFVIEGGGKKKRTFRKRNAWNELV